jgi:quercetin 2,3-dioxygenase
MTSFRTLRKTHPGRRDDIADLITRQSIPNHGLEIDPFLLLNHHGPQLYPPDNNGLPFGPHPHRGFETVTFIVEGALLHRDTGGHESAIHAGGVQWMTAGRGLEHAEISPDDFLKSGGMLDILQLWVNLPSRLKMTEPRYIGLRRDQIPELTADDGRVSIQLISGEWEGERGPIESLTEVMMSTVVLRRGASIVLPAPSGRTALLYVVRGRVTVDGHAVEQFHLAGMNDDADAVEISTGDDDALVIYGHAAPIGEPVVAHGPFVMNTEQEIHQAIRDYQAGRFAGKVKI